MSTTVAGEDPLSKQEKNEEERKLGEEEEEQNNEEGDEENEEGDEEDAEGEEEQTEDVVMDDWEKDEDPEEKERQEREAKEAFEKMQEVKRNLEEEMKRKMEEEMKEKMEEEIKRLKEEDERKKEEERKKKEEEAKKAAEQADPNAPKPRKKLNINAASFMPEYLKPEFQQKFQQNFWMQNQQIYQQQLEQRLKQDLLQKGIINDKVNLGSTSTYEDFKKDFAVQKKKESEQVSKAGAIGFVKKKVVKSTADQPAADKTKGAEKAAENKKKTYKRLEEKKPAPKVEKKAPKEEEIPVDPTKFVEVDETRAPMNIVFIGHVDAGKSTTCGNILLLSGKVDLNELRKFEQEAKEKHRDSWYLAYIMDINEEERAKGKTVEVGKATFQTNTKRFTILDAPGHKNYVPNMIAGAAQADIACLVISSKTGEFESGFEKGGQTKEHAMLAMSLGVKKLICLINKMDEDNWSEKRYNGIKEVVEPFLEKSCGYTKGEVSWIPYSGLQGDNIKKPLDEKVCSWYKGPTLFDLLDSLPVPDRNPAAPLRIPVLDKMRDQGLFLFGKIEAGTVKTGMNVMMMPYKKEFTALEIYNSEDNRVAYAKPGENIKIKVKGLDDDDIKKGYMVTNASDPCQVCQEFEAKLQILELPDHKPILSQGYTCVLHLNTTVEEVEISTVVSNWDAEKKKYVKSSFLKAGITGQARISCKSNLCLEKFETNEHLGRFTLRDEGKTIAIGFVEKIKPIKKETVDVGKEAEKK